MNSDDLEATIFLALMVALAIAIPCFILPALTR